MRRRHGFQTPLDPHQVGSFVLFFFLVAGCYVLFMPFVIVDSARWGLVAAYSLLICVIIALNYWTSITDPSDKGAREGDYFCATCQANVCSSSKHCRACDRCTEGFDHHCKWLNNCIGSANYRTFFMLVSTTLSMLALQFAWGCYLFITSFTNVDATTATVLSNYNGGFNYHGWQAAVVIYMVVLAAASIMLGELMSFHLVLVYKGMTTYDYIMTQKEVVGVPAVGTSLNWRQHALCRANNRIVDSAAPVTKRKVGLNPCKALMTPKQEPKAQAWRLPAVRAQAGGLLNVSKQALGNSGSSASSRSSLLPSSLAAAAPVAEQRTSGLSVMWRAQQDGQSGYAAPITDSNGRLVPNYQLPPEYRAHGGSSGRTALSSILGSSSLSSHTHQSVSKLHSEGLSSAQFPGLRVGHQPQAGGHICSANSPFHPTQQDYSRSTTQPHDTPASNPHPLSGGLSAFSQCIPGGGRSSQQTREAARASEGFDAAAGTGTFSRHPGGNSMGKLTSIWNPAYTPASSLPVSASLQRYFPDPSPHSGQPDQHISTQLTSAMKDQSSVPLRPLQPGSVGSVYLGGVSVAKGNHLGGSTIITPTQSPRPLHLNYRGSSQPSPALPAVAYPQSPTSSMRVDPQQLQQQQQPHVPIFPSLPQTNSPHIDSNAQHLAASGSAQTQLYQSALAASNTLDSYPAMPVGVGGHVSA